MKWTEKQEKIINERGKNILVSAAAGSGKTAVLVERIKDLIIKDGVPLKSMLIVTFTNAAAGEMKQRIIDSINKELRQREDPFLRDQIQNVYSTHISTFHAFAISILKRYYHIAGIDPSFNICPENKLEVFKNEALELLLESEFKKQDPNFIRFMNDYASSKSEDAVRTMILDTYNFTRTIPDPDEWLEKSVNDLNMNVSSFKNSEAFRSVLSQIAYNLRRALRKNESLIKYLTDNGVSSLAEKAVIDSEGIKSLINTLENDSFEIFLQNLGDFSMQRFTAAKAEKESYEEIKEKVKKSRDSLKKDVGYAKSLFPDGTVGPRVTEITETYPSALVLRDLVIKFARIFSGIKEREEVLDFNDVEHLALRVLADDDVSSEYKKKFEYIFIDEYQDSNYIQEAFIDRIKRENNLFMVGDVKQSIYKFRRAEPSIFISRYDRYGTEEDGSIRIDLNKNFRSKENIISCINSSFSHIMERELSGMDYDEKAYLYKGLDYDVRWDIPVDFYVVDSGKQNDDEADERINEIQEGELEAHKIAEIIKSERGKIIYDVKKSIERPLEYRDMVILLRTVKNNASIIYETLMSHGIPTFADGGEDYLSTVEIETFVNLLRIIDNRRQDVPLVSAMYSPIFGFTTEELIRIRLPKKTGNYYSAFQGYMEDGPDEDLRIKCIEMNSRIDKWKRDESFMALDDFLWMLMNESGYYNYAGALIGGQQRRANLRALIDRASDYSAGKIRGLFGFISYIDTIDKNSIKMGQIKLLSENDDVVRITSVHKSKGLEYPYVILARLGKKFNKAANSSKVRLAKDLGLALQWENYDLHAYKKTLLTRIINENADTEELAEEIRILYVAMTRAMDKLILIGSVNSGDKDISEIMEEYHDMDPETDLDIKSASSYLSLLLPLAEKMDLAPVLVSREEIGKHLYREDETHIARTRILERIESLKWDNSGVSGNGQAVGNEATAEEIDKRLNFEYPFKKSFEIKSKYSVTQLNEIDKVPDKIMTYGLGDDLTGLVPEFLEGETPMTASERGTVLHTVLEKLDFKDALTQKGDPEYIEDFLESLWEREILSKEERDSVSLTALKYFIDSDIIKRAAASDNIQKERPFNLMREIDGEQIIVQGIIDCYFEENGKYVLIDYKSNYVIKGDTKDQERIRAMYEKQIALYREALAAITGREVSEAFLYLTGTGETIDFH